jgi:hypothetical protein
MTVTNSCSSLIGSLSMPTYEVVMRRDTFVGLFLNIADFSDVIFDAGQRRSLKPNLLASAGYRPSIGLTFGGRSSEGASHVEHHDKIRYRIVPGPGHARRFIGARRRRFGRSGTFRLGRGGFKPGKRCRNRHGDQCVGRPERDRKRFQGSRAAAAEHNRPGDSAVQVRRTVVALILTSGGGSRKKQSDQIAVWPARPSLGALLAWAPAWQRALAAPKLDRMVSDQVPGPLDRVAISVAGARLVVAEMPIVPDGISTVVCHVCAGLTWAAQAPATIPIH